MTLQMLASKEIKSRRCSNEHITATETQSGMSLVLPETVEKLEATEQQIFHCHRRPWHPLQPFQFAEEFHATLFQIELR